MDPGEAIANFMAITGCADDDQAMSLLQATDWRLEEAVNLFYAAGPTAGARPKGGSPSGRDGGAGGKAGAGLDFVDVDEVRAPLPTKVDRLYGDVTASALPRGGPRRQQQPVDVFRDFKAEGAGAGGSSGLGSGSAGAGKSGSGPAGLSDLFKPPQDLLYRGDLHAASATADREGRWLMVNVHAPSEFASHQLNRDTFSHPVLKEAIKGMFLFIQLPDSSPEAKKFVSNYRITDLPATLVLDPITGAQLYNRSGFIDPEQLLEDLVPFMDHRPQDAGAAKLAQQISAKRKGPATGPAGARTSEVEASKPLTEDEELARAIAMSMEQSAPQAGGSGRPDAGRSGASGNAARAARVADTADVEVVGDGDESGSGYDNTDSDDYPYDMGEEDSDQAAAARERAREEQEERELMAAWEEQQRQQAQAAPAAPAPSQASPEEVQAEAASRLPAEPGAGDAGGTRVGLRGPDGSRHQRRFALEDTVQALHDWFVSINLEAAGGKKFSLAFAMPGAAPLDDMSQTLAQVGAANAMVAARWL